jgi:hypothetical protein
MRHVFPARVRKRPRAIKREGDRAAVGWDEGLCQLARFKVKIRVLWVVLVCYYSLYHLWVRMRKMRIWRWVERGEGCCERCDRPCALGSWIVLCCAGVVGVGEEEREECQVEVMGFLR